MVQWPFWSSEIQVKRVTDYYVGVIHTTKIMQIWKGGLGRKDIWSTHPGWKWVGSQCRCYNNWCNAQSWPDAVKRPADITSMCTSMESVVVDFTAPKYMHLSNATSLILCNQNDRNHPKLAWKIKQLTCLRKEFFFITGSWHDDY